MKHQISTTIGSCQDCKHLEGCNGFKVYNDLEIPDRCSLPDGDLAERAEELERKMDVITEFLTELWGILSEH